MNFFESVKKRMPHFFSGVDVLEYGSHDKCKTIRYLFSDSKYVVLDPNRIDSQSIDDNSFNVTMSINRFQDSTDYLNELRVIHRLSSKFVMFSCNTAGNDGPCIRNLTQSDFYNYIDLDSMFETYKFEVDYPQAVLYFWGVKKDKV
jgi:hypothetical protein